MSDGVLYHYVSEEEAMQIAKNGIIHTALGVFGNFVYLNSIPPTEGRVEIAKNNWGGSFEFLKRIGALKKVEVAIGIPARGIPEVQQICSRPGIDLWAYPRSISLRGLDVKYFSVDILLYHYTSLTSLKQILRSGYIHMSLDSKRAHFGPGVYLTGVPPSEGKHKIAVNNWNQDLLQNPALHEKTEVAIEIPLSSFPNAFRMHDKRGKDIWLYPNHIPFSYLKYYIVVTI